MTHSVSIEDIGRRHKQIRARNRSLPIDHLRFGEDERPISHRDLGSFERPFPALSPGQRLHLDLFGYVVVESVLTASEVEELRHSIYEIEAYSRSGSALDLGGPFEGSATLDGLEPAYLEANSREYFRINNLPHLAPCFFDYVTHPRLVGMAEEVIGSPARLEQSDAHIRRPPPQGEDDFGFHRGWSNPGTVVNGLYHCPFVKALTNLTHLGPDDGGTAVIAGSHRLPPEADIPAVIAAALENPATIHQVEAPAGSTLLFFESLLHSSGIIRSGQDRVLIIAGFTPPWYQPVSGFEPSPALLAQVPEPYQEFLDGSLTYFAGARFRKLDAGATPLRGG